jgi:hypothetical protein
MINSSFIWNNPWERYYLSHSHLFLSLRPHPTTATLTGSSPSNSLNNEEFIRCVGVGGLWWYVYLSPAPSHSCFITFRQVSALELVPRDAFNALLPRQTSAVGRHISALYLMKQNLIHKSVHIYLCPFPIHRECALSFK